MTRIENLTRVDKIQSKETYNSWYNVHKPLSGDSAIFYLPLEENIVHKHMYELQKTLSKHWLLRKQLRTNLLNSEKKTGGKLGYNQNDMKSI